jgi:VanZ family protein
VPNAAALGKCNHFLIVETAGIRLTFVVPKLRAILKYWLPPAAWMVLIFSASADPHSYEHSSRFIEPFLRWLFPQMSQAHVELIHHVFRKCCHLAEYAVLALLLWRAIRRPDKKIPRPWNWDEAGLALSTVFLYAASDEFHQIFVPTRTPLVSDVFIDTTGGAIGLTMLWIFHRCRKPQK